MRLLPDLVRENARRTGAALAVSAEDARLTYAELDREADRLAHQLRAANVRPGARVALWLPKSAAAVVAMQAVLRLGAAYVPIDPLSPRERIERIIRDCAPAAVLTTSDGATVVSGLSPATLEVELGGPEVEPVRVVESSPDDLAYVLYTSGSTGTPKGVCLSHRNALAFVEWAAEELRVTRRDRLANHAPLHFDLSVLDLYVAFHAGASVHLVPQEIAYAPRRLVALLAEEEITVWYSVPSVLVLMARDGNLLDTPLPHLRVVLFAGEPYPVGHLRALRAHLGHARLLNLYGPTETNVCTCYEVTTVPDEWTHPAPIGKACSGDRVWAVHDDGTVAGPGEEGELMVAGPTVMLGYHGGPPRTGPYATGDRVLHRFDGDYLYLGRRDSMAKIRGNRVELGDIEAALHNHPRVSEAAVTVAGAGIEARIVAHIVPVPGSSVGLLELKRHCATLLPRHMIVDRVHALSALPRTVNGKVDRQALQTLSHRCTTKHQVLSSTG